ncbi:hypothetical protein Ahy_A01g003223 isoform D [Arachis hypogaea]|uniref:Uncharacterized protein n=1 Tax=Arachis hypogaea TaxID=3818 RepID=A0A445ESG2_ARAHY|nr:hypothetical protein Ahy_A01g003223 isoform D [Arachis hypogaea]
MEPSPTSPSRTPQRPALLSRSMEGSRYCLSLDRSCRRLLRPARRASVYTSPAGRDRSSEEK